MARFQRSPHPSPLQMLAILQARAEGLSSHEIQRRTGHANMSILRWFDAWSHDAKTLDNLFREHEIYQTGITFDDLYPKREKALPDPSVDYRQPSTVASRFKTALGLK